MSFYMRAPLAFLAVTGCLAVSGCSGSGPEPVMESAEAVRASYCEVFVDRIQATRGSHGLQQLVLFFKTSNLDAEGGVAEVGLQGLASNEDRWRALTATRFVGASDYFQLYLTIGVDPGSADETGEPRSYEGAVFVKTRSGKTLWVNASDGGNFYFDNNLFNRVEQAQGRDTYSANPRNAATTADSLPELNRARCR